MDDVQLANYVAGVEKGPIEATKLERSLARALFVPVGTPVLLSDHSLTKTKYKHPEISFQDYLALPEILSEGFALPGNHRRSVGIVHLANMPKFRTWSVVIKAASRDEVFLTMFHRYNINGARRLYRRAKKREQLIRDHKNMLAHRELQRASNVREGGAP